MPETIARVDSNIRRYRARFCKHFLYVELLLAAVCNSSPNICFALGLDETEPFLEMKGAAIGRVSNATLRRDELLAKLEQSLGGTVRCIGTGPMDTKRIGIVTGGAGGEIHAAAGQGIDTYITGEAPHWAAVAAEELGINLFLGGHYATETFGVKVLAADLAEKFEVPWEFLDHPTGL